MLVASTLQEEVDRQDTLAGSPVSRKWMCAQPAVRRSNYSATSQQEPTCPPR